MSYLYTTYLNVTIFLIYFFIEVKHLELHKKLLELHILCSTAYKKTLILQSNFPSQKNSMLSVLYLLPVLDTR